MRASGTADAHVADLGAILARTRYLLIDFDGPICSICAGLPAPQVAEQLRKLFTGHQLPEDIELTGDPIEVFAYAGTDRSPDTGNHIYRISCLCHDYPSAPYPTECTRQHGNAGRMSTSAGSPPSALS